jgi:hypothetical protein
MNLNPNSIVKMFFTHIVVIFFIVGCGSESGTIPQKKTNVTDFSGTYTIYEELKNCTDPNCYNVIGYDNYEVTIEQTENQAQLTIDDQPLSCTVTEDELTCEGIFTYSNGNRISYTSYTLFLNDTDKSLTGSAEWTFSDETGNSSGQSELTTIQPEVGSILIYNSSYTTYQTFNLAPCGSNSWNPQRFIYLLTYLSWNYIYGVNPGCYILHICEEIAPTDCPLQSEITVNRAETNKIEITPSNASAVQLSLSPN